jgi:catechol 2,3-dioxygenase-like lactoylglutathione lyase family enzyme
MVVKPSKEMRETLDLPEVSQIGIVVRDLEKAVDYYQNLCGLGPFVQPEITFIEKFYDDIPTDFEMNMAFCSLGPVEMELIQPVTPPTVYHDFIEKRGEGLHHLGFDVQDMEARLNRYREMGIRVMQMGRTEAGGFAYLDTETIGGVIIELIQRKSRRV